MLTIEQLIDENSNNNKYFIYIIKLITIITKKNFKKFNKLMTKEMEIY